MAMLVLGRVSILEMLQATVSKMVDFQSSSNETSVWGMILRCKNRYGCWTKNRGILPPKWMVKIMENLKSPNKMDDLGVPWFLETPILYQAAFGYLFTGLWLFRTRFGVLHWVRCPWKNSVSHALFRLVSNYIVWPLRKNCTKITLDSDEVRVVSKKTIAHRLKRIRISQNQPCLSISHNFCPAILQRQTNGFFNDLTMQQYLVDLCHQRWVFNLDVGRWIAKLPKILLNIIFFDSDQVV